MDTTILADMEGKAPELLGAAKGVVKKLGGLHRGMNSGEASVGMVVRLDDGTLVLAEMSMKHFIMAAMLFEGAYAPEERGG